ncbi:hypothetical protein [Longitalea luteola]|uniref:hypothetical protein n=1 Tax=Longitalea luteola TaxID=2812563 RepID=UPI001A976D31|nr:hypothetical protein [Longitalea luteola]
MENLHNPGEFSLGYLKLGKPYEIPLLLYDETSKFVKFSFDKTDEGNLDEIIGSFIDKLINPEPFKLKILDDERLPLQQILLGHSTEVEDNFNFYLAKHPGNKTQVTPEKLKPFAMALTRTKTDLPQHEQYIPKMSIKMIWKEDHLRVFGKYAFNCLSFLKGKNFVLNERFDGVRGWIANGGHNIYAKMNNEYGEILAKLPVTFPELSHVIHFTKIDRHLVALVSLYETSSVFIDLADNFDSPFEADTWICDWKNRKEYRLMEYLNTLYPGV